MKEKKYFTKRVAYSLYCIRVVKAEYSRPLVASTFGNG